MQSQDNIAVALKDARRRMDTTPSRLSMGRAYVGGLQRAGARGRTAAMLAGVVAFAGLMVVVAFALQHLGLV
jgi:chromate transport protein ChrA